MVFAHSVDVIDLILKGLTIGIIASAPMGPIGILVVQRTLKKGRWYGFATGIGAALSDIVYAVITGFGMSLVLDFIEKPSTLLYLRLIGGREYDLVGPGIRLQHDLMITDQLVGLDLRLRDDLIRLGLCIGKNILPIADDRLALSELTRYLHPKLAQEFFQNIFVNDDILTGKGLIFTLGYVILDLFNDLLNLAAHLSSLSNYL